MSSRKTLLVSLAAGFVVVACNNDPAKDKSKAVVTEPGATAQAVAKGATALKFSNADSKISYVGAKVTRKHEGNFGTFNGTIQAVDNDPTKSTVTVEVETASITSDDAKLTNHLKSPDFFDVAKFPKAKFTSTSIKPGGENGATHTVTGNLDLHGVTKAITFPATIKLSSDAADVDSEFVINRKDFSIVYPGMPDDLIKDQVSLKLQIRAKRGTS